LWPQEFHDITTESEFQMFNYVQVFVEHGVTLRFWITFVMKFTISG